MRTRSWVNSALEAVAPVLPAGPAQVAQATKWTPDAPTAYCRRCGASVAAAGVTERGCAFCLDQRLPWSDLTRLAEYHGPIGPWVVAMKFHQQWAWSRYFGRLLADALSGPSTAPATVVTFVPMHPLRLWGRGYNQAQLIASALARRHGWRCVSLLRRARHTRPQTDLAVSQRHANVRSAFALPPVGLDGYDVVLVDDVKTTGSTLRCCARLLVRAGARRVRVAVAAVADPHRANFTRVTPRG